MMQKFWKKYQKIILKGAAIFFLSFQSSYAEPLKSMPIHVESNEMRYDIHKDIAFAEGNAWASQGDNKLEADQIIVKFQEKVNSSPQSQESLKNIQEILAFGHVRMSTSFEEITGDSAVFNVPKDLLTVYGKAVVLTSPKGRIYAHESISYDQKKQEATALGNVVVVSEDPHKKREMTAPKVIAYFKKVPSKTKEEESLVLRTLSAQGGVIIQDVEYVSKSDCAHYDAMDGLVKLTGNVKITDGKNIFEGPCGEYNEKTGKSRLIACPQIGSLSSQTSRCVGAFKKDMRVRALLYPKKATHP